LVSDPIEHLLRVNMAGGPSLEEALLAFARLRSTPHEGRAVSRLLARDVVAPLPEPLLVAVASALIDRDEGAAAASALSRCRSIPALVMRADLLERSGDPAAALVLIEQVLARDVDWAGARERHARWGVALGRTAVARAPQPGEGSATTAPTLTATLPFRVLREAGRGGSATVFEAEDPELRRRIALKVYHRPDRDRAKLLHEARVAVAVAGQGVVPVLDIDPERGWLVMRWAPLGALTRLVSGHPPDLTAGLTPAASHVDTGWVRPLAQALARVHAAGWVHHDLKPANVLLQAPDVPMLADFGTARRRGEPSPPGSLGYVSAERLAGRPSDPRDDVYAFGRILAEILDARSGGARSVDWRSLAEECTGPDATRPRDGVELIHRIDTRETAGDRK
jgi:tRNA A-37 threonylcarbamoyl transferase component Bud32